MESSRPESPRASRPREQGRVMTEADLVLVGGGLANGLIAFRFSLLRPDLRILVLESGPTLGGAHTWSFHTSDLSPASMEWISPFISRSWNGYSVRFPKLERTLPGGYHSILSSKFHEVISRRLGSSLQTSTSVRAIRTDEVELES